MKTFELSENKQNGERNIKLVLLKIHSDSCVDIKNEVGTEYNDNGCTWIKEYVEKYKDTIVGKSITCEFLDEDRTEIYGHGYNNEIIDGIPVFPNATSIGHFTKAEIETLIINDEEIECLVGYGIIDNFRYKAFCDNLYDKLSNGDTVCGSVEIFRTDDNNEIVYKYGYKDFGRIPTEFIFSGYALLGIRPSDKNSILLEINSDDTTNNKEEVQMNETEIKELIADTITKTISEINSKNDEINTQVAELNVALASKDKTIEELNGDFEKKEIECNELATNIEALQKALDDLKKEQESYWEQREILEKQIAEFKVEKRLSEMNDAISKFTEEEVKYAEVEINSFKENPLEGDVDTIVSKVYSEIGKASKEKQIVTEQNSANHVEKEDILGYVEDVNSADEDAIVLI